ncbi:unnamed protein product [Rotaria magnacalcarata]|uniref:Uncharacterized protein n=2 Tax=Rotaria magnacalcarata TaxID=392030 RepID=A0A819E080_9BILA|nr:unnamed protein product [Rotaria magnacalcarata]CAF1970040.1 unnamed protein product [Rotaria magnacalcarata]CAF3842326.1 unnamed protein product [Rotaria magnacalcarata]CAF3845050.1 unnamed protein product [Rotaria magnacalcarata]
MDPEVDDDDLRSLSDRILPVTSASFTNNTSSRNNNNNNNNNNNYNSHHSRTRLSKPQKSISHDNQLYPEGTSLPMRANTGDIMQMSDGTRKKYNGSSWRRMCSKLNCSYYTQSQGLCKPHLAALKKRKISKNDSELSVTHPVSSEQEQPKKGDIIVLPNGIRKKYDGRQYRRVCSKSNCTLVTPGSLEYQNGLCPQHYQELRGKANSPSVSYPESEQQILPEPPSSLVQSINSSPSRKRRRLKSPSSGGNHSQLFMYDGMNKNSIPKPNRRLSIAVIPATVDINHPNKGDIIEMENGSRKKFDGVVWRTICSIPECLIAAQRNELCRKHFIKLNGKPNTAPTMAMNMMSSTSMSIPRVDSTSSTDDKIEFDDSQKKDTISNLKEESIDYDDNQHDETNIDNTSQSYSASDNETNIKNEQSLSNDEDNLGVQIDHTLINALSASREKFPTTYLKKWLREHRSHPYPSNQEKSDLAKQSSITYDQVTTWFNNARAILRRRQAKLQTTFDTTNADDNEEEHIAYDNKKRSESLRGPRTLPLFNGICCRSIGVQCSPSTVDQTTITSTKVSVMTDDELTSDRTIRILTPSSRVLTTNYLKRNGSHEFLLNGIKIEDENDGDKQIIVTSTCLDDDQMGRLKDFCSKFQIELSNVVDEHSTHLVTDEEDETLVCPLSKKVIQAVARHMYIVTYRWIDACLKANRILNEKSFEIQGDLTLSSDHNGMQRSRQSILPDNLPKNLLLENFSIMLKCNGCQEMMNNDELIELVQLSGAKHTTDSHFARIQTGITRIVLCEKEYLINRREMYEKCIHAGIHFLTPEWFLESLVQYRIQPFQEYQITP